MVGENIFDVFSAVPTVVGENILEFFLILGATGHGCSAEGTDAAPRAHGTGALQASQTYVRTTARSRPSVSPKAEAKGGVWGGGSPPQHSQLGPSWIRYSFLNNDVHTTQAKTQAKPSQATGPPRAPPGRLRHYIFMLKRTQTTRQEKKIPADSAEPQPNAHRKKIRLSGASPSL